MCLFWILVYYNEWITKKLIIYEWVWYKKKIGFLKHHFQQYFSYIVAVSFIDVGNWSTRRKPPACASNRHTLSHNVVRLL